MAEKEYQRMWGRGIRRHGAFSAMGSRLWLGKDHLLSTDTQWYTQEYKRFYYRDIQAIIIRKTVTGKVINSILGALTLLPLAGALATSDGARVFWAIVTGFFGFILLLNVLLGPTCRCHMRTAVQTEELPSLGRMWLANRLMARLRPLVIAAQGEIPAVEIPARMEQLARPGAAMSFAAAPAGAAPPVMTSAIESAPAAPTPPDAGQTG